MYLSQEWERHRPVEHLDIIYEFFYMHRSIELIEIEFLSY